MKTGLVGSKVTDLPERTGLEEKTKTERREVVSADAEEDNKETDDVT
jgi:hypothetical protein